MTRTERWALALLLLGAWVLRASPFFRPTGVLGWSVDYDEGVYLSASAALAHGQLPWRDFAFLHPPVVLALFAPLTAFDPSTALKAARWLMTVVGVANVGLVFALVRRHTTVAGAFVGAALYAAWPEAVINERRALLEPLLNLAGLAALFLALGSRRGAGVVLGLALGIKSWAVFWLAGVLGARAWRVALVGVLVGLALISALALFAPQAAIAQLLLVHLGRPPDGDLERLVRLREMFVSRSVAPLVVLLGTAPWLVRSHAQPVVRALGLTFATLVAAFLAAAAWWNQYDTALAGVVAPLCGVGVGLALPRLPGLRGFALALLLATPAVKAVIDMRHEGSPAQLALGARVAEAAAGAERVCAFEAVDVLLAHRWPSPPLDSYGQQLVDARAAGPYGSMEALFASDASQVSLIGQLERCDVVVRGWRGDAQLNATSRAWFERTFELVAPDVWRRRR
jgi:hypothetical protein